jgi:bifunctional polynucleotide phosphatase/kinase
LVGPPASGKSTFYRRHLKPHNYVHINRDTLSTQAACLKQADEALKAGKSVCIDNTNPSRKTRGEYIDLAKKHKLTHIRCVMMQTPIELCHHLNYVRQTHTRGKVRRIPDVGYNMYKSQWEEPKTEEGFTEILKVDFSPHFESSEEEKIFKHWTA